MTFRSVFIAIVSGAALIVAALIVNGLRPAVEVQQPTAQLVEASGKCAECHAPNQTTLRDWQMKTDDALATCLKNTSDGGVATTGPAATSLGRGAPIAARPASERQR